jgi:heme-degrading monooxygenase HmoA
MYMLFIDGDLKPGKKDEFLKAWNSQILPLLKKQPGFVDEILLVEESVEQPRGLSFWKTREDGERYLREGFPQAKDFVQHLMQGSPNIRKFEVESAQTFNIRGRKAA